MLIPQRCQVGELKSKCTWSSCQFSKYVQVCTYQISEPLPSLIPACGMNMEFEISNYILNLSNLSFQGLEKIIEKDFFPDLAKMKAHSEYMEALEKNDLVKLRELEIKFSKRPDTEKSICKYFEKYSLVKNRHTCSFS